MGLSLLEKLLGRKIHVPTREELEMLKELEERAREKVTVYVAYVTGSGNEAIDAIRRFVEELCSSLGGKYIQHEETEETVFACRLNKPFLLRDLSISVNVDKGELKMFFDLQRQGQEKLFERAELRIENAPFSPNAMVITGTGAPTFFTAGFSLNKGVGRLLMSKQRAVEVNEIAVRIRKKNNKIETIFIELSPFQGIAEVKIKPPTPPPPIVEY